MESLGELGESQQTVSHVLMDHAQRPRNNYPLLDFDGRARITGTCGDTMEVWVKVRDGVIEQAAFITEGCAVSHACGSMTTCMAEGRSLEEIEALEAEHVIKAFRGLPPGHEHCADLSSSALKLACANIGEPGGGVDVAPEDLSGIVVRVALPLAEGFISGTVESAERFALVDVEAASMCVVNREDMAVPDAVEGTENGAILPVWLQEQRVQVLICGSMDEDTRILFAERGVQVVLDPAPDIPEELIAEYLAGSLRGGGR
ncbi:MAG: hypothetical protein GX604_02365 [Actinobacteria bacterium]|nr:hypothetical protein [Actinomycetota bacterium]